MRSIHSAAGGQRADKETTANRFSLHVACVALSARQRRRCTPKGNPKGRLKKPTGCVAALARCAHLALRAAPALSAS